MLKKIAAFTQINCSRPTLIIGKSSKIGLFFCFQFLNL